jgi:hypothetical protein
MGNSESHRLARVTKDFLQVIHTLVLKVLFTGLPPDIHRAYT